MATRVAPGCLGTRKTALTRRGFHPERVRNDRGRLKLLPPDAESEPLSFLRGRLGVNRVEEFAQLQHARAVRVERG